MILTLLEFLRLADRCPEEEIILMPESEFNDTSNDLTDDYYCRVKGQQGFFHSATNEPLDLWPRTFLELMNPREPIKRFIILGY